jgi:CBS domain containing-hemolysin-like protein
VFGEIVPKSVFQQRADVVTPKAIFVLKFCSYLFYPILLVFSFLARMFAKIIGGNSEAYNPFTLREEIRTMVQMSPEEGDIAPIEQSMIKRLFNFGETTAREVMTPLIDVAAIEREATCKAALDMARKSSHVRIPVYRERVDRIVGVLNTLELLGIPDDEVISGFVRPVNYTASTRSIQDLLLEMRKLGEQVTVVVDEFGGAEGIVSIEDILEEVVEDMQDEYDTKEADNKWLKQLDENTWLVSARIDIDDLSDELGIDFPKGKYASLAGFLLEKAGDVPETGEMIEYQNVQFTIQRATPRTVQEVKVSLP